MEWRVRCRPDTPCHGFETHLVNSRANKRGKKTKIVIFLISGYYGREDTRNSLIRGKIYPKSGFEEKLSNWMHNLRGNLLTERAFEGKIVDRMQIWGKFVNRAPWSKGNSLAEGKLINRPENAAAFRKPHRGISLRRGALYRPKRRRPWHEFPFADF